MESTGCSYKFRPNDKRSVLHNFFSGENLPPDERIVCPWGIEAARKNDIVYVEIPSQENERHNALFRAIREYRSGGKSTLVAIAPEDPETQEACRLLSSQFFLQLCCAFEHHEKNGKPLPEIKRFWENMWQRLIANPEARIVTGAILGFEPQNTVVMGPRFERTHPRYAPHLCLVTIRAQDIADTAGQNLEYLHAIEARQTRERKRLQTLSLITVMDVDGDVHILNNEFYPTRYIQMSRERYETRIARLMAQGRPKIEDLIA